MMKDELGWSLVFALVLMTAFSAATTMAKAEMLVIESNVPEIQVGVRLPDGVVPKLGSGGRVKVLLPSHETRVFQGLERPQPPYGGVRGFHPRN